MKKILDFVSNLILAISLDLLILLIIAVSYLEFFSQGAQDEKVRSIYAKIVAASGQAQDALPLVISDEMIDNAYNDGNRIVIYRGLINHCKSWDEVALILGHEAAHGNLYHLRMDLDKMPPGIIATLEGNADKMGAVYMMKAGYDVCKGREVMKRWKEENGNALGQNHPDFSYRYDELNINCE